ncbi:cadmium-translocating P-type ATPase [Candidatus Woesearchaeota archaeon]|nr:cadmium-translocating P-type ATPase [Candidatus Woesearchaeota archaeon]
MKDKTHNHENEKSCSSCATDILEEKEPLWKQKKVLIMLAAGIVLAIGLYLEFLTNQHLTAQILFFVVVIVAGYDILKRGFFSILKIRFDMNLLISIAAIGAFLIGHGEEGAAVIFLFFIAEFLEDYAAERARKSIASLLELAPETAAVKRKGNEIKVHVHEVNIDDILIVRPGDRIPLDGTVVKGASSVNQAPITGESMPVSKAKGDDVFAGTINEEGYLEIKVTKKSDETTLSKIVKLVNEAQKQKSKTEVFIDKFAKYYTPTVIILAALVMIIPTLVFGLPFSEWFYKALVLLVISCPCALAISTPVSMVSSITSAAKNGVLIKGGNFIEEVKKVKVMVFDKTGTLTEGKPEVIDIVALNKYSKPELLQIAACLESKSKHPLAEAILESAKKKGIKLANVCNFKSIAGKGLKGSIRRKVFFIGSRNLFKKKSIIIPDKLIKGFEEKGKTTVLVGNSSQIIGIITLMDKVRKSSLNTINELKNRGIKTIMLTGDNERVANAIAKKLAIDEYYAELLPEDKVAIIDKLLKKYEHVVMVGDGVNDAPALAKAHVGIAMGAMGSDVAIETADIALMHDDLSKINYLIDLSRKTMSIVKQNVSVSILIKSSFAILAFPGIITLWLAVAVGDMGLSLAVILNALRIGRKK